MDVHCLNLNYFQECTNIAVSAGLFGFVIGGFSRSRKAFDLFVAENKHEMFRHPREAQVLIIIESCAKSTYFNNLLPVTTPKYCNSPISARTDIFTLCRQKGMTV